MVCILLAGLNLQGYPLKFFGRSKMFKGFPVKCFAKVVARGNAVQMFANFPAKRENVHTFLLVK